MNHKQQGRSWAKMEELAPARGSEGMLPRRIFFEVDARRCVFRHIIGHQKLSILKQTEYSHLTPLSFNAFLDFLKNLFLELKDRPRRNVPIGSYANASCISVLL